MKKKYRFTIFTSTIYFTIGLITLLIREDLYRYFGVRPYVILTVGVTLLLVSIASILYLYVQGNFDKEIILTEKNNLDLQSLKIDLENLINSKFENEINDRDIKQLIVDKINDISNETFLDVIESKYGKEVSKSYNYRILFRDFDEAKYRIEKEIARLTKIGNINLSIGFFTTFMAIFFLGFTLTSNETIKLDTQSYLFHIIPRITLSLFIELFSFFFLKMYKENINTIKYFNNERTNIELKFIALKTALLEEKDDSTEYVIKQLSITERNFILKKDESTVELAKHKQESTSNTKLVEILSNMVKGKGIS